LGAVEPGSSVLLIVRERPSQVLDLDHLTQQRSTCVLTRSAQKLRRGVKQLGGDWDQDPYANEGIVAVAPSGASRDRAVPEHMPNDVHHLGRRLEVSSGVARGVEADTYELTFAG